MPLLTEFRELGFELSRIIKKEIEQMKLSTHKKIENIQSETQKKIKQDIVNLENSLVQKAQFDANKKLSDQVNQTNIKILETKKQYVESFLTLLEKSMKDRLKTNYSGYFSTLSQQIEANIKLLETDCILYVNSTDLKKISETPEFLKKFPQLKLASEPIQTICGFKINASNKRVGIDLTFESQLVRYRNEITRIVMASFPVFTVSVTDASELYKQIEKTP